MNKIGRINEQPLHAALKLWYADLDGKTEVQVEGYYIDVVRENQLIEIQTGNFPAIKSKLYDLTKRHSVTLVYPIAAEKWLLLLPADGSSTVKRRKSPKRSVPEQVFSELVSFPELMINPNFLLELAMVQEEEVRHYSGEKAWHKNGWVTVERRLVKVLNTKTYHHPQNMLEFLPETLPDQFTTLEIANYAHIPSWLAQKMAFCLCRMGSIQHIGKMGRSNLYGRF